MDIIETIKKRGSVRTFAEDAQIDFTLIEAKIAIVNSKQGPFGNNINVTLVRSTEDSKQMKLGTYGMIKGASNYLVVTVEEFPNALIDLGYLFEELVLYATHLGLGTVWMAGTFSRKHFKDAINLADNQLLPIVSPIGIKVESKRFMTSVVAKSKTHVRKDFGTLFTDPNGNSLQYDEADPAMVSLEMVRLAPSAMNRQPWRVIKEGNNYHFYTTKRHGTEVDLGIALYHFDITMMQQGYEGDFSYEPNDLLPNYIITWSAAKSQPTE